MVDESKAGVVCRVISGAVSPDTAHVVEDYPYGFRLRCRIRYWVEASKHGQRVVSQTTNPKRGDVWNKPKASTYSDLRVLYVDEQGHVQNDGISFAYADEEKLDAFLTRFAQAFADDASQRRITLGRAIMRARRHVTITIHTGPGPAQSREEQAQIMRSAVGYELRAMRGADAGEESGT